MNTKSENIDFWIGRVIVIGLFLFILSAFSSNDYKNEGTADHLTSIEYISEIDNSAIAVTPLSVPDYNNSLSTTTCGFLNTNSENRYWIHSSNKKTNLLLQICTEIFINSKPSILKSSSFLISSSICDEDYTLIS